LTSDDLSTTELDERTAAEKKPHRRVLSASTLTGDKVINAASEDLGKVDEIMIDIPTGRVAYAVLSFGGFLGRGDKLFAIPWDQLTVAEGRRCFVLNVNRATLENAPASTKITGPIWLIGTEALRSTATTAHIHTGNNQAASKRHRNR
jgi:sporulation protein YlmC with PRC-barrel domain